jgi:hypothetical protein
MTTAIASISRHATSRPSMRRLFRGRGDRVQALWSTVLVLATMAACVWIATPDFAAGVDEATIASQGAAPSI